MKPAIIVHGGAWSIPDEYDNDHIQGVCHAVAEIYPHLKNGMSALDAVEFAVKTDSTNHYDYTVLPLALVLNSRFEEAGKIYQKYNKIFMLKNIFKSYGLIYQQDIEELEAKGITHPDFTRVKELLKN